MATSLRPIGSSRSIQRLAVEIVLVARRFAFFDSLNAYGLSFRRKYVHGLNLSNPSRKTNTTETESLDQCTLMDGFINNLRFGARNR